MESLSLRTTSYLMGLWLQVSNHITCDLAFAIILQNVNSCYLEWDIQTILDLHLGVRYDWRFILSIITIGRDISYLIINQG